MDFSDLTFDELDEIDFSDITFDDRELDEIFNDVCSICGFQASDETDLHKHTSIVHFLQCPYCINSITYTRKGNLIQHIKSKHERIRYECNECLKLFTSTRNLNRHIREQHQEKQFACMSCDRKFSRECSLLQHVKSVHVFKIKRI